MLYKASTLNYQYRENQFSISHQNSILNGLKIQEVNKSEGSENFSTKLSIDYALNSFLNRTANLIRKKIHNLPGMRFIGHKSSYTSQCLVSVMIRFERAIDRQSKVINL